MKTRLLFRIIILILSLLVFSIGRVGFAEKEEQQDAKDLTRSCRFEKNAAEMNALYAHDQKLLTACALKEHDVLTVQTKTDVSIGTLFFRFGCFDSAIVISQYDSEGSLLKEEAYYADSICAVYRTEVACQSVKMKPLMDQISICELEIYGIGTLPKTVPQMEPAVVRTDFLIVSTHPDDEWLFLGAVYPIYGGQRGLMGTFAYVTTPSFGRLHEAINSLWKAKMTTMPFFLNFPDVDRAAPQEQKDQFQAEEITLSLVRLYRRIKPLVVITQDPVRGEYGHWQHIVSANSALEAALLAPDPSYDPESAEMYGTWTVQKVYQHMAEENQMLLDVSEPLSTYNGKTALQVAIEAYRQHVSQQKYSFFPSMKADSYGDIRRFGLTYSNVGADTGNDMFEHIDPNLYAETVLDATPTPEPTPEPTQEPTPGSTEEPTKELKLSAEQQTPIPVVTERPSTTRSESHSISIPTLILFGIMAVMIASTIVLFLNRRNSGNQSDTDQMEEDE